MLFISKTDILTQQFFKNNVNNIIGILLIWVWGKQRGQGSVRAAFDLYGFSLSEGTVGSVAAGATVTVTVKVPFW